MSRGERVWVFTGGEFSSKQLSTVEIQSDDFIVGVDSGVKACLSVGLLPNLLVGDFDSASPQVLADIRLKDVPRLAFSSEKASSDLELALEALATRKPSLVSVFGVSGGRTDHMLFNWHLITRRGWQFNRQIIDDTTHSYVLEGDSEIDIDSSPGTHISLLAMNTCDGVTTTGLYYPLQNATVAVGSTLGLSNVVLSDRFCVKINHGTLLVMVQLAHES